jgi:signal transduction histidine kinase
MLSEFITSTRRQLANQAREKEAQAELLDNGGGASVKIGEIIRNALEQNELINCSKLFANYHAEQSLGKAIKNKSKLSLESLITPIGPELSVKMNEKIDKIWNDDNAGLAADSSGSKTSQHNLEDLNLEVMSSSTIDLLAEKLFSQGVQLDLKIPENLMVKGKTEVLEQTLYHLINYAINSIQNEKGEKNISIFAHRLGDVVAFDLIHSGQGFDEEILKQRVGIAHSPKQLDIDLQICQSLLEEMQAKIQLDNKLNQNGEITGGRVKIIFRNGENSARSADLKIGSKKEILANRESKEKSYSLN